MIGAETLAVTYGIGSPLTWGAADFSGGMATRKNAVLTVLLLSQLIGLAMLLVLVAVFGEVFFLNREYLNPGVPGIRL